MSRRAEINKVVIVGAGFAGLAAAKALSDAPVEVTVLDRHNYHLFQPLLYQVATAALTPAEIAAPIRGILRRQRNVRVLMDEVTSVDTEQKQVLTSRGKAIEYDTLVLATGARHSYFGNDNWAQHAPGLKTIDDAFLLRKRILAAFEKAEIAESQSERLGLLNFVIVGAGPTGVELAGAIAELARSMANDFRSIDSSSARIVLIEAGAKILPAFDESLSAHALKDLESLGVEVRLNTMVTDITDCLVTFGSQHIPAGTVIWAAGVQASPAAKWLGLETGRTNHLPVGSDLSVLGLPGVFAIGDTASHIPEGASRPLPGVAPVAKQMGEYVGRRVARIAQGREPGGPFRYTDRGSMATIGRNRAIAEIGRARIKGFPGWLLWGFVHLFFLVGHRNRAIVMLTWAASYLTWQRSVRLITNS